MNIQQRIKVGLFLSAFIIVSTGANAKNKIKTCADLKTNIILKKADPYKSTIEKYARLHRVDADFVLAIAAVETCFNARAISPVGAKGLMQLMPATAKRFGVNRRSNVNQSIKGGTKYLKFLMRHYKSNMRHVAAAYNAGEGRVDRYKGVPPYRETRRYVRNVLRIYNKLTNHRQARKKPSKIKPITQKIANRKIRRQQITQKNTHSKMYKTLQFSPKRKMSEQQTFQLAVKLLLQ